MHLRLLSSAGGVYRVPNADCGTGAPPIRRIHPRSHLILGNLPRASPYFLLLQTAILAISI